MSGSLTSTAPEFILASGSPRRQELTQRLGLVPIVCKSDVPEEPAKGEGPRAYTERLALDKAQAVAQTLVDDLTKPAWILSADTIVVLGDRILEKPQDAQDARKMLLELSGKAHEVITAFCWLHRHDQRRAVRAVTTEVHFKALGEQLIARYVASGEPMDKAGAYGIQGLGGVLVDHIVGSYSCVVGLPIAEVIETLDALGGLGPFPFLDGDVDGQ